MGLEIIWNIHCKSLQQKGTDLLTSARDKFWLWKMAKKKIKTCDKRRINGGHNVVGDVGQNVAVLDVGLRSGNVASSYSDNFCSSSNRIFTNNVGIFDQEWVLGRRERKRR